MSFLRKITPLEKLYQDNNIMVQFGLRVSNPSKIPEIIGKLQKYVIGINVRAEGNNYVKTTESHTVFNLPQFPSLIDTAFYMAKHHTLPFNQSLASIGANKDTVILNANHVCCDGEMMLKLVDMLQNNVTDDNIPEIFDTFNDTWKDVFPEARKFAKPLEGFTRVIPKDKRKLSLDGNTRQVSVESKATNLKCYDKVGKTIRSYHNHLWTSVILSSFAFNNKKFGDACLANIVGTRKFLKTQSLAKANQFSSVPVRGICTPNMSVKDFAQTMRRDFDQQHKVPNVFAYIADYPPPPLPDDYEPPPKPPGVLIELSNIGKAKLKQPFVDFSASLTMNSATALDAIALYSYSVESEARNHVVNTLRYCSETFSDEDANIFINSIKFSFENIDFDMTCKEAVDEIYNFQKYFIKNYK